MSNSVDLSQLAVDRTEAATSRPAPARRWLSRYVFPFTVLAAFAGLWAWAAKDSLIPSTDVTVVPVIVAKAQVHLVDSPLFQAAGWVEPRPASVVVTSLAEGVIEELLVIEGQRVAKGEPVARLLDTDARLALSESQAELAIGDAEVASAFAELQSAQIALNNPLGLRASLADADSELSVVEAELQSLPAAVEAAKTRLELANESVQRKRAVGNAIGGNVLRQAQSDLATAKSTYEQLLARQPILSRQQEALARKRATLGEQLELKLDLKRQLATAKANVDAAKARRARAELQVRQAELQLQRMTVTSPIDGRVLSVLASAGKRVAGMDPHTPQGAAALLTLYDPARLQVRVDVRLEDVPQVELGQRVRIETASLPEGLDGTVISVTSFADIQKNTLQIKAALSRPPEVIRPEMLAQVTFLAPEPTSTAEQNDDQLRVLIPRQLATGEGASSFVWLVDQQSATARRQPISLGHAGTGELVEVTSGLTPTDKLIANGHQSLSDGDRIRIVAEDSSLGVASFGTFAEPARNTQRQHTTQRK